MFLKFRAKPNSVADKMPDESHFTNGTSGCHIPCKLNGIPTFDFCIPFDNVKPYAEKILAAIRPSWLQKDLIFKVSLITQLNTSWY